MTVVLVNVLDGLYSHLTGDSTLNTALGGTAVVAGRTRHAKAQRDEPYPYLVYQIVSAPFFDTMQVGGYEMRVQFTCYDTRDAGPRAVVDVIDKLRARLHRVQVTVTNHRQMTAEEDVRRGPEPDGDGWRMDADYFIRGFET